MFFVFFGAYLYSCTVFAEGINPNDRTNIAGNQELLKLQSIQESTRYVAPEAFLNWLKSKRFFLILTRAFKDTNDYDTLKKLISIDTTFHTRGSLLRKIKLIVADEDFFRNNSFSISHSETLINTKYLFILDYAVLRLSNKERM